MIEIEECAVPMVKKYLDEGGFLVWHSLNLANPNAWWITPLNTGKPTWQASNVPTVVTDPNEVVVNEVVVLTYKLESSVGYDTINICYIDKKEPLNEYLKNKTTQITNPASTVADR